MNFSETFFPWVCKILLHFGNKPSSHEIIMNKFWVVCFVYLFINRKIIPD